MADGSEDWPILARRELLRLRGSAPAWGYRAGASAGVEPSALACLGLLATRGTAGADDGPAIVAETARWLASLQRPDGSLGLSEAQPTPGWTTPLALLVWQAQGGHSSQRRRAVAWLLAQEGRRIPKSDDPDHIVGHDTMLAGWPWVDGTHSWLEPTALAVLALCREGLAAHLRVAEGYRLIRDRAIETGGWNYGNKSAFGHALRPQPAPTGLALLALAHREGPGALISQAIRSLQATLPGVRASASLGWGLLGLRAWERQPEAARDWLAEAYLRATGRPDAAPKLSLLLMAGGAHALELFE